MARARSSEVAHAYAVRLMQYLVVPTFVIDSKRRVMIWNRACERLTGVAASEVLGTSGHWRAFYEKRRYCLADLVALGRQDKLDELYPEQHTVPEGSGLGFAPRTGARCRSWAITCIWPLTPGPSTMKTAI